MRASCIKLDSKYAQISPSSFVPSYPLVIYSTVRTVTSPNHWRFTTAKQQTRAIGELHRYDTIR